MKQFVSNDAAYWSFLLIGELARGALLYIDGRESYPLFDSFFSFQNFSGVRVVRSHGLFGPKKGCLLMKFPMFIFTAVCTTNNTFITQVRFD
jgi:hypothetical protein